MLEVRLTVAGFRDSDPEEQAELAWGLQGELSSLDVESFTRAHAEAPPGAKGAALDWAQLVVSLAGTLPALVAAVRSWTSLLRAPGKQELAEAAWFWDTRAGACVASDRYVRGIVPWDYRSRSAGMASGRLASGRFRGGALGRGSGSPGWFARTWFGRRLVVGGAVDWAARPVSQGARERGGGLAS